jgi:hypothetical protein
MAGRSSCHVPRALRALSADIPARRRGTDQLDYRQMPMFEFVKSCAELVHV